MSSPYHQGFHQGYYDPISEPVQWVWVPVPIKVISTTATLAPVSSPPINLGANHVLAELETPMNLATWPQACRGDLETAPGLGPCLQGIPAVQELSPGLDLLPLEPFELDSHAGPSPPAPMGLPDQCSDVLLQSMDFSFSDPWSYPATIPGQETESLGTATPAGTPPAQPYVAQSYQQLPVPPYPGLDCFDTLLQNVDLPKQNRPHGLHASPKPTTHRFHCRQCPKTCPNQRTLDRHLWSKHPGYAELNGIKSVKRKCSRSGCEYFGRVDNVQRHERTVHGVQRRNI